MRGFRPESDVVHYKEEETSVHKCPKCKSSSFWIINCPIKDKHEDAPITARKCKVKDFHTHFFCGNCERKWISKESDVVEFKNRERESIINSIQNIELRKYLSNL